MWNTDQIRSVAGTCASYGILLFYTGLALLPLYLMVVSSLIPLGATFEVSDLEFIPGSASLDNLWDFNDRVGGYLGRWMLNSFIVSTIPVVTSVFFSTMAGYALSKLRFPGRQFLFWVMIATMTIPHFVVLIPLYELVWSFGWMDTYMALIVPFAAGIIPVFLARQFLQTMPSALLESATIDGCNHWGVFWHVVLPLSRPLIGVLTILGFVRAWMDYFWAYLVVSKRAMFTVQVGIMGVMGVDMGYAGQIDYGEIMAGSLVASLPVFIVFLSAQKYFVRGITIGALKG